MNRVLLFILIILSVSACKTRQKGATARPDRQSQQIRMKINEAEGSYQTFSGKAKVSVDNNGKTNNLGMNIRMRKDSVIWISVTALAGIEVARALITPDSIKVLDRVNNKYIRHSFSYLGQLLKYDIDFATLQALMTGFTPPALVNGRVDPAYMTGYLFAGTEASYLYKLIYDAKLHRLREVALRDTLSGNNLQVVYSDFEKAGDLLQPYKVEATAETKKDKLNVELSYSRIIFNEILEYSFIVPKKYE